MTSVNNSEIQKFEDLSKSWWDESGPFKALHQITAVRLEFIHKVCKSVHNQKILDVGCGGGLVSLPLAKKGADVSAVDMSKSAITVLNAKAKTRGLKVHSYLAAIEDLGFENVFDVVLALDIIEHVDNPDAFLLDLFKAAKPNGIVIISTISLNLKSVLLAKYAAEYLLGLVPPGTHDWRKFMTEEQLIKAAKKTNLYCELIAKAGISLSITDGWALSDNLSMNYTIAFKKAI